MNTYSLCHNAPISEFIEMLRDWLIAGNADPRAIDKMDTLRDTTHEPTLVEDLEDEIEDLKERITKLENELADERNKIT